MKKIITLFAFVSFLAISGCSSSDDNFQEDNDTIPEAFEIKANFTVDGNNTYVISDSFSRYLSGDLFQNESVLIYRLDATNGLGSDVWQLIPNTLPFTNGDRLTYDFNFSKEDFTIFATGNFNLSARPSYLNAQVFRIVIIQLDLAASVDTSNYNEVMNTLKLSESQVRKVKL